MAVVVVVAAALPTLWIVGLSYLAHFHRFGGTLGWCARAFGVHSSVPGLLGVPALIAAVIGTGRVLLAIRKQRRLRCDAPGSIEVAGHERPFAYTLPGRGGHIVLSSALVDLLDAREREVVVAHECAHARYRHDRYLLAGAVTSAAFPPRRPPGSAASPSSGSSPCAASTRSRSWAWPGGSPASPPRPWP